MVKRRCAIPLFLLGLSAMALAVFWWARRTALEKSPLLPPRGERTTPGVVATLENAVRHRLEWPLRRAGFQDFPAALTLIAIKDERKLELWGEKDGRWRLIKTYPFTSFSGTLGPKLREGDRQIPEGIYSIEYLNPNSRYHLSFKLNYPNAFDREMAAHDGRTNLGDDIMIHGSNATIGCIPVGDEAIEEIFVAVAKAGMHSTKVIISPTDFRKGHSVPDISGPAWTGELHQKIAAALEDFSEQPQ